MAGVNAVAATYLDGEPCIAIAAGGKGAGFGSLPTGGKAFSKTGGSSVISRNAKSIIGFNPVAA